MNRRIAKTVRALALGASLLAGCREGERRPVLAIVAIDVSDRAETRLLACARSAYAAQRSLPRGSMIRIYVFGHDCELVYTGEKIAGRDAFNRKVGEALTSRVRDLARPGTHTELVLDAIGTDAGRSEQPVKAWVVTDGGLEDQSPQGLSRLRRAVTGLEGCLHLQKLVLCDLKPEHRLRWEGWLSPLKARAEVLGVEPGGDR